MSQELDHVPFLFKRNREFIRQVPSKVRDQSPVTQSSDQVPVRSDVTGPSVQTSDSQASHKEQVRAFVTRIARTSVRPSKLKESVT